VARRVRWATPALENLQQAAAYIGLDSPRYAAALVREARDAARSLRRFSDRGRLVPEAQDASVRELFIGSYRLIYRVFNEEVQIIAFVHSARRLGNLQS
jgi:toxin ParE1/3/4